MITLYLAIDKDGTEKVSNNQFYKFEGEIKERIESYFDLSTKKYENKWFDTFTDGCYQLPKFKGTILPKGSIKKLTNVELTWDDNPIKIEMPGFWY